MRNENAQPELIQPRPDETLKCERLAPYLRRSLMRASGKMRLRQFANGHANLTYLIAFDDAEYVLRRPPLGALAAKAHDMQREHHVLSHLHAAFALAPASYLYCDDESIIGAPFQVMERRCGVVVRTATPPPWQHQESIKRAIGEALIDTLCAFHAIDREAVGLGNLGRPEGFVARQLAGWAKRWQYAKSSNIAAMDSLIAALYRALPDESRYQSLVHNDYKLDNLLLQSDDPAVVVALLDWDMCTSGDPLMDLGYLLNQWAEADDPPPWVHGSMMPTAERGYPTRVEAVQRYAAATERGVEPIKWYHAFAAMKFAVVIQQIFIRYAKGQTQDQRFADYDRVAVGYIHKGCAIIGASLT